MNPSAGAPSPEQYAKGLRADSETTAFINKKHSQREAAGEPKSAQLIWRESEGRYDAARLARMRAAWAVFHYEMADRHRHTLAALVSRHEAEAARYEQAS